MLILTEGEMCQSVFCCLDLSISLDLLNEGKVCVLTHTP